jgi:hypothetical protein
VVIPTVSDRIRRRILPVIILTPVMGVAIYALALMSVDSPLLPFTIFGLGFTSSYAWAMFLTIVMELPEVGRQNVARASGYLLSASGVGAFFSTGFGWLHKGCDRVPQPGLHRLRPLSPDRNHITSLHRPTQTPAVSSFKISGFI